MQELLVQLVIIVLLFHQLLVLYALMVTIVLLTVPITLLVL